MQAQTLDDWLEAMPVRDIDQEIAETEKRLALLRMVKGIKDQLNGGKGSAQIQLPSGSGDSNGHPKVDPARLSKERKAIIRAMLAGDGTAGPAKVAALLQRTQGVHMDPAPIQTNMSRMAKFGLLEKQGQGRYRVPSYVAELVVADDEGT